MRGRLFQGRRHYQQAREVELGDLLLPRHLLRARQAVGEGRGRSQELLELFPDQPHVLNYLGYSWIDQGVNLDEGMRMIKRSVEQRADDGYIVDSLGWAYYRLGNMDEAVKQLERAVELKPE